MRVLDWSPSPIHEVPYRFAGQSGRVEASSLLVTRATVESLPDGLDAIVLTSDLQGREWPAKLGMAARLLGEVVAEELALLADLGTLPPVDRVGVVLAGDLYAKPDLAAGRGGSGDVRVVWEAFRSRFRWVCGVAGNHDRFGIGPSDLAAFTSYAGVTYLDGGVATLDGLHVAGVGGIVGKASRDFRRTEDDYRATLTRLLAAGPDLVIVHGGPDVPGANLRGSELVRSCLLGAAPTFVVCGHCHWDVPFQTLANGTQVCNVDARVVVLQT